MKKFLQNQLFAVLLGLIDGILTVLTLATGKILDKPQEAFSLGLAMRVALVTSVSGACMYFISEYSKQRIRLIHAEKELNFTQHGKFVTTNLGKQILKETIQSVFISGSCSFLGAFIPMSGAVFFPRAAWLSMAIALLILALLGWNVAKMVYGNVFTWVVCLFLAGLVVSFIGYKLHVI
jgi:predicted membrane protein (TIGR00267 family)